MLSVFLFLREFFAHYVLPGTTCACHDFVHAKCFLFCPHTTTKHAPLLTSYMLSFFFFLTWVFLHVTCCPIRHARLMISYMLVGVFSLALTRPPNMQSWRLQSVTLTFLYKVHNMVTIRTKKIAIATTPTRPYPITEVVPIACGLRPSSTKLEMALAC